LKQIKTTLKPFELLDRLKAIEDRLGRVKTVDKGPRSIDLDILLYENVVMVTDRLTIPHPLMHEREFALRPVSE
jgi:2-amino-4-hydroxy-6-hydroxymethyldihydropteridine diphosphokinase/dihydropteroate synthase